MNIEIVDYHPHNKKMGPEIGTLHVFLIDLGLDVRGCSVIKKGSQYIVNGPVRYGYCPDAERMLRYPVLAFTDQVTQKLFMHALITKGRDYVKAWYAKQDQQQGLVKEEVETKWGRKAIYTPKEASNDSND